MTNVQMREILYAISAMLLASSVIIMLYIIFTPGVIPFFDKTRLDMDFVNELMNGVAGDEAGSSFINTAKFYSAIGSVMDLRAFLALVGAVNLWLVYREVTSIIQICLTLIWSIVVTILVMNAAGKDVITVCLVTISTVWLLYRPICISSISFIALLYGLYALIFRE